MDNKNITNIELEAQKYENVSTQEIVNLFKDNHIYFPDYVHRFILIHSLKKSFFDKEKVKTYPDELLYRLRSYNYFSIYLLESLHESLELDVDIKAYKVMLISFFLKNKKKFKTTIAFDKAFENLKNKKVSHEKFSNMLVKLHELFYTPKGYLDGLSLSILKESVSETYTLNDLKELGAKYGVDVPRRINKSQLIEILAARFRLSNEEKVFLQSKSVLDLTKYAKEKGFKISADLKKADMVEFIIFSLNKYHEDQEKDLFNYDIISEEEPIDVEQVELATTEESIPVSEAFVEEAPVKEAEVVEEVEETPEVVEVIEEPVVEETPEVVEEVEEEAKPVEMEVEEKAPQSIADAPEVYYDETIDNEIRSIIKSYYDKKARKDKASRATIIIIFIVVLAALAYFALSYFGVIKL